MNKMNLFQKDKKSNIHTNEDMKKQEQFFELLSKTSLNKISEMPIGISDFEEVINNKLFYVDKTGLIEDLLSSHCKVTLFTRPRRFGKTLAMSMLENFFNITKNSKELFTGLKISKNVELCNNYMNQYPTIFITLKEIEGENYRVAFNRFKEKIIHLCTIFSFLINSTKVSEESKELFSRLKSTAVTDSEIVDALAKFIYLLYSHYNKPVILLIDEYDVPLAKATDNGYYNEMLSMMRGFMQVLKDNSYLKFAIITGCLRISKESIFTGTNNFYINSITAKRCSEYFGFTHNEVQQMLEDAGALDKLPEIKEWYDGYNFGDTEIYCPWDVINYVNDYLYDEEILPKCYWNDTSSNSIIRTFINNYGNRLQKDFTILLKGGSIQKKVKEDLTYDLLHSSIENFWSILFLTGYLTGDNKTLDKTDLRIPNKEVQHIYEDTLKEFFNDKVNDSYIELTTALWSGNAEVLSNVISKILLTTISFHDYKEDFYHAFLLGILTGLGYDTDSNKENGEGRSDIVVQDYSGLKVVIFEVKHSAKITEMEKDCDKALAQIRDRKYTVEYEDNFEEVICYGISFFKKRCLVKTQ